MHRPRRPLAAALLLIAWAACSEEEVVKGPPAPPTMASHASRSARPADSAPATARPVPHSSDVRAIWVTRFDWRTAADVERAIDDCADLGMNRVLFQVRGNGTAFWRSRIEPWADELGGVDPGFDPLEIACEQAHRRGIELHAWVNVMPSWKGTAPPSNPAQLYLAHPDWHWFDEKGRRQPLKDFYVSLNPCLPEVRDYLVALFREIVVSYPVDGLHLDYVRFPDEEDGGVDYPRDARTLALYSAATGRTPAKDRAAWQRWKGDQVTTLVRAVKAMLMRERPGVALSAAVAAEPERAGARFGRESARWAAEGIVDAVYPMNYTANPSEFAARADAWKRQPATARVVTGVEIGPDRSDAAVEQELRAALARCPDVSLFSYGELVGPAKDRRRSVIVRVLFPTFSG